MLYSEEALEAAVALSHRYIPDRFLPDKVCVGGVRAVVWQAWVLWR